MKPTALLKALFLCLLALPAFAIAAPLKDLAGDAHSLREYTGNGQWTVVMIWSANCGVCHGEAPKFEAFHQKYRAGLAQVVGLSVDGAEAMADARAFVADHDLSFTNLVGEGEDVAALFYDATGDHLVGTPGFLVFDPQGELRTYQVGTIEVALLERFMQQAQQLASAAQ